MTDRWEFWGGEESLEQFREWAGPHDMLGADYIAAMLPKPPNHVGRYMLITSTDLRLLNDLQKLTDEFPEKPAVLLDSWGAARGLVKRITKQLFRVERKSQVPK